MSEPRKLSLIVNPASGGGKAGRKVAEVASLLQADGHDVVVQVTKSLEHARELTDGATVDGRVAVATGGDGLVNAVAGAIASGSEGTLAIVPLGRGNDFARELGITNIKNAVATLRDGSERYVDLGFANGRFFTCIASVGFDSDVIESAERTKLVRGALVYPYATVKALAHWQPARFTVESDGRTDEIEGFSVAVANSGYYGGGMHLAPNASITDGLFEVVAIEAVSKKRFLAQGPKVFRGSHVNNPEVRVWRAKKVTMDADRSFIAYADGEPLGKVPVTVEMRPGALRVLSPKPGES